MVDGDDRYRVIHHRDDGGPLVGETVRDVERHYQTRLIGTRVCDEVRLQPAGGLEIQAGTMVAMLMHSGQVDRLSEANGLIIRPADYRVKDFMRAGGLMTVLFLVVSITAMNAVL